jgi:hypothetical protein
MSDPAAKPRGKRPDEAAAKDGEPGRLELNERGDVTWQWTDEELLADNTLGAAERMRALVDPKLDIVDESDILNPTAYGKPSTTVKSGYNPYNSGSLAKDSWKKKKDLRELSKWIELRKKMAEKKDEEK